MDPVKRKTIIKEIEYWRSGKLLPEHYCDFLLNLYVEGKSGSVADHRSSSTTRNRTIRSWIYIAISIPLFALIYFYFTSFHLIMQTIVSIMLVLLLFIIGIVNRTRKPAASFISLGVGALLSLFLGVFILQSNGLKEAIWTVSLLAVCGVIWIAEGIAARSGLLHLCGHFVLLLSWFWMIGQWHSDPSWFILQAYTLPICFLLYYLGKLFFRGLGSTGFILLVVSALYLLSAEMYGLVYTNITGFLLQLALGIKIVAASAVAWALWKSTKESAEWLTDHD